MLTLLSTAEIATAQGAARAAFVEAVRLNGCSMDDAEARALLPSVGLTMEVGDEIAGELVADGAAYAVGSRVHLSSEACGAAEATDPRSVLVAALNAAGCEMTEAQGMALGLGDEVAGDLMRQMVDAYQGTLEDGVFRLSPGLCAAQATPTAATPPPPAPASVAGDALAVIATLEEPTLRGAIGLHLMAAGCRVAPADPLAVADIASGVAARLGLGEGLPEKADVALGARIAEVLDKPGPAYQIDAATGDLVLRHCTP